MYLTLKIGITTYELLNLDGDSGFIQRINHAIFQDRILPYISEKLSSRQSYGGVVISYHDSLYRLLYQVENDICNVLLLDGSITFEDVEKFTKDNLTNLFGKSSLYEEIENLTDKETEERQLILFDIDSFRRVNDMIGRDESDHLLKDLSARLRELPGAFQVYRYESDCFAILRTGKKLDRFIQGIRNLLELPFTHSGKNTYITLSIGSVDIRDFAAESTSTLIDYAVTALNTSKDKGKNGWVKYTVDLKERNYLELEMEGMIRDGVKSNQFILYYQPQYSFKEHRIVGAEALIRWNHPTRGFVSPAEFIPVAERSGLVVHIGEWVIQEACRQQREWLDKGYDIVKVGVNIGSLHFKKPDFIEEVKSALDKYNLPAKYLGLEITEGSVVEDVDDMIYKLSILREMGIQVSIDDFGTGYSSLSYLTKFQIDTLKIDQSFVNNMPAANDDIAIVKAIIDLAKNLNIKVIAEGVETDKVKELLLSMDCPDMQGYLVSRPIPGDEFERQLITNAPAINKFTSN